MSFAIASSSTPSSAGPWEVRRQQDHRDQDPEQRDGKISGALEMRGDAAVGGEILFLELAVDLLPQFRARRGCQLLAFLDEGALGVAARPAPQVVAVEIAAEDQFE